MFYELIQIKGERGGADKAEDMAWLLDMGANGISSDRPGRPRKVAADKQRPLPTAFPRRRDPGIGGPPTTSASRHEAGQVFAKTFSLSRLVQ